MTDLKARRVSVHEWKSVPTGEWGDDPTGTHMLVPVEVWERVVLLVSESDCTCEEPYRCDNCVLLSQITGEWKEARSFALAEIEEVEGE